MDSRQSVLIVDDTAENIRLLMELLRHDYSIQTAINGLQALKQASSDPKPDIILLDIMMPGMSGYEVCVKLKADPKTSTIPIIFVSAMAEAGDEAKGLGLGGIDYITKPFVPELVKARIHNHLELKRHQDNLEGLVRDRTKELALTQEATIMCMSSLAETRDPETGGHIRRTQNYVRILAEHLACVPEYSSELTEEICDLLYKSTPLHDIGKVGVPDHILLKPGRLTDEEFEIMKTHALLGWKSIQGAMETLGSNSFLKYAAEIALTHHEKWDGSGYPYGLKKREIPLSGRLMAIADVYDALISRRIYKPPFSHNKAVSIIEKGRGCHFDPGMVDVFIEIHENFKKVALTHADSAEERTALCG